MFPSGIQEDWNLMGAKVTPQLWSNYLTISLASRTRRRQVKDARQLFLKDSWRIRRKLPKRPQGFVASFATCTARPPAWLEVSSRIWLAVVTGRARISITFSGFGSRLARGTLRKCISLVLLRWNTITPPLCSAKKG